MERNLDGRVVLITGASSGIGAASAVAFARQGCKVILAARRVDRLEVVLAEVQSAGGAGLVVPTDVTQSSQLRHLLEAGQAEFGPIDILLNNAGFGRLDWLDQLDPEADIEKLLSVNLNAAIQLTRLALPQMLARRSGHVINLASVSSFIATPTYTIYAASKFGLRGFTDALRREVGGSGIQVSGVYPGPVATEFELHTGAHRKTGYKTPRWILQNADQIASVLVSVARRPRRTVIVPGIFRLAILADSLFPGLVDWIVRDFFVKKER
jgi:short-subunit dehydrogenase